MKDFFFPSSDQSTQPDRHSQNTCVCAFSKTPSSAMSVGPCHPLVAILKSCIPHQWSLDLWPTDTIPQYSPQHSEQCSPDDFQMITLHVQGAVLTSFWCKELLCSSFFSFTCFSIIFIPCQMPKYSIIFYSFLRHNLSLFDVELYNSVDSWYIFLNS